LSASLRKYYLDEHLGAEIDMLGNAIASRTFTSAFSSVLDKKFVAKKDESLAIFRLLVFIFYCIKTAHVNIVDSGYLNCMNFLVKALGYAWSTKLKFTSIQEQASNFRNELNDAVNKERQAYSIREKEINELTRQAVGLKIADEVVETVSSNVSILYSSLSCSEKDVKARQQVYEDLKIVIVDIPELTKMLKRIPGFNQVELKGIETVTVELFGSSRNGLSFRGSGDVDVSLVGLAELINKFRGSPEESEFAASERSFSIAVTMVRDLLVRSSKFNVGELIVTSRVPLVKCKHVATGIECDVASGNTLALHNTELLQVYCEVDSRVRPLIFAVKYWAKMRGLCDASQGTLSSYGWVLLVLFFMQQTNPHVLPSLQAKAIEKAKEKKIIHAGGTDFDVTFESDSIEESQNQTLIGKLLFDFFIYYALTFRRKDFVVSIRIGKQIPRSELPGNYHGNTWRLAIEDPFELHHDLGSKINSLDKMKLIHNELLRAATMLVHPMQGTLQSSLLMSPATGTGYKGAGRCFTCGSMTHHSRECSIKELRPLGGERLCLVCGKPGHLVKDCPRRRAKGRGDSKCRVCGVVGHLAKNCPKQTGKKTDSRTSAVKAKDGLKTKGSEQKAPITSSQKPKSVSASPKVESGKKRTSSSKVCRGYLIGHCKFGDACNFSHISKDTHPPGM